MNEYQKRAKKFAKYPKELALTYCCVALAGEVGELCNDHKKELRDKVSRRDEMIDELGDVLWYVAATATELGVSLSEVAEKNLKKLKRRHG